MTLESSLWSTTSAALSPFGKLVRLENSIGKGEGDVVYCLRRPKPGSLAATGFLELKVAERQVRDSTPIRPHHLTLDQVLFTEGWASAGGRAFLLLRMPPWYLLFDPPGIRGLYDGAVSRGRAELVAVVAEHGRFPLGPILRALTK